MPRFLCALCCTLLCLAAWCPLAPRAQTPVGDGLRGDYYDGMNFERFVRARRDAVLDFNWREDTPTKGVPAEQFTVRWTGWLLPPVTGRYVLHFAVDDGVRLWLNGRQLLDEWRGQPLSYFSVPVELQAGRPYRLRLDYCQYSRQSRLLFMWERPRRSEKLSSWRNLWNFTSEPPAGNHYQETVPTRYLFSYFPTPPMQAALAPVLVVARTPAPPAAPTVVRHPQAKTQPAATRNSLVSSAAKAKTTLLVPKVVGRPLVHPTPRTVPGSAARRADTLAAHLAKGQALTLRALYFEQGKADLPALVQASLDTLAKALRHYPTLRLEVQGHTDNQGDPELNRQLSQRRAEAVCRYLAERGIAASRLQPLGLGGTQPVANNAIPAERPRNRRVVLRPLP